MHTTKPDALNFILHNLVKIYSPHSSYQPESFYFAILWALNYGLRHKSLILISKTLKQTTECSLHD